MSQSPKHMLLRWQQTLVQRHTCRVSLTKKHN